MLVEVVRLMGWMLEEGQVTSWQVLVQDGGGVTRAQGRRAGLAKLGLDKIVMSGFRSAKV